MEYTVELYREDGCYCACIGADNSSGYEIVAETTEELAKKIGEYFADEPLDDLEEDCDQ